MSSWQFVEEIYHVTIARKVSRYYSGTGPYDPVESKSKVVLSGCDILNVLTLRNQPSDAVRIQLSDGTLYYVSALNGKEKLCCEVQEDHIQNLEPKIKEAIAKLTI